MHVITSTEYHDHIREYEDIARHEPVHVTDSDYVMVPIEQYRQFAPSTRRAITPAELSPESIAALDSALDNYPPGPYLGDPLPE